MQNWRLDLTSLINLGKFRGLMGTVPGLNLQKAAGQVFGRFWNRTKPLFRSKPGTLAGYPDPLPTLMETE